MSNRTRTCKENKDLIQIRVKHNDVGSLYLIMNQNNTNVGHIISKWRGMELKRLTNENAK